MVPLSLSGSLGYRYEVHRQFHRPRNGNSEPANAHFGALSIGGPRLHRPTGSNRSLKKLSLVRRVQEPDWKCHFKVRLSIGGENGTGAR